ncbi:Ribokinase-like protein [Blyttiomyces helicus]|uniref:Ribokinase-like protein n=1 Tax=Blyttiomyces helicus TaxID=388810 RepID=A0A4P9WN33_9FUNG|nr:Ribokinase-like protein [Blyttiomyces helicus]|eukprot:RKO92620.1 Ribokinase-like protein [Blyttiomyces helicus]
MKWVESLQTLRPGLPLPLIVWEPSPASCQAEHLAEFIEGCRVSDCVSPNDEEAGLLFGAQPRLNPQTMQLEHDLSDLADSITSAVKNAGSPLPTVIIRAAHRGCLVVDNGVKTAIPAYWAVVPQSGQEKVVDTTGAGNSFLGGWMSGHFLTAGDPVRAAVYGSVAASFTVERVGVPALTHGAGGVELWNGDVVGERVERLVALCGL